MFLYVYIREPRRPRRQGATPASVLASSPDAKRALQAQGSSTVRCLRGSGLRDLGLQVFRVFRAYGTNAAGYRQHIRHTNKKHNP